MASSTAIGGGGDIGGGAGLGETKRRGASGRADLGINEIGPNGVFLGQSIVIPTKGCE